MALVVGPLVEEPFFAASLRSVHSNNLVILIIWIYTAIIDMYIFTHFFRDWLCFWRFIFGTWFFVYFFDFTFVVFHMIIFFSSLNWPENCSTWRPPNEKSKLSSSFSWWLSPWWCNHLISSHLSTGNLAKIVPKCVIKCILQISKSETVCCNALNSGDIYFNLGNDK